MSFLQENLVCLDNISYKSNGKSIVNNISFNIKAGSLTTIIGPNGSGKTTIAKLIISSLKPSSGNIYIKPKTKIGYMPQKIYFDANLPLDVYSFLNLKKLFKKNIDEINEIIDVKNLFNSQIYNISGGELQKILLVFSLIDKPDLLIMDEPTQGLDVNSESEFYKIIEKIREKYNSTILIISHDLHMVMKTTDYVLCINKHICCEGVPENIGKDPAYRKLFGDNIAIYSHDHDHTH